MADEETVEGVETQEEAPKEQEKTFTQEELDKIVVKEKNKVKSRYADYDNLKEEYDKLKEAANQNEELAKEFEALKVKADKIANENSNLKHEKEVSEWKKNASKEFGVDVSILRGNTEEEINAHAQAIKDSIGFPKVDLSGAPKEAYPENLTERQQTEKAFEPLIM